MSPSSGAAGVCSAEHAGWLSTPVRRLVTDPARILEGLVAPGDVALDAGCGPGFFTLPLAEAVGPAGSVIAVDLQQAMLDKVGARAEARGLLSRIRLQRCEAGTLGLAGQGPVDFALAFWMVHEVPDARHLLGEIRDLLRPHGRLLLAEPRGHVGAAAWERTLASASQAGLAVAWDRRRVAFSRAVLLERAQDV